MSVLVVDLAAVEADSTSKKTVFGFRSVLPSSVITGANEDLIFPFANAIDFRDNTKYSPSIDSGVVQIVFSQSNTTEIDYFAFAIHNSQDAGLSGVLEVDSGNGYETVLEFANVKTNKPYLQTFDSVVSSRQRLTLTFTSKLYIGNINIGKSLTLNRSPSVGFQPAKTASLDEVEQFTTHGNNFIVGRRLNRGFQTKGTLRFISFNDEIDDWYEEYMNHVLDSKTLYFKWNESLDDVVYGLQNYKTLTKPTYTTSFFSDISFEINGYA